MQTGDFVYYSKRCRKHRTMAALTRSHIAVEVHQRLARIYADKAASAMNELLCPRYLG